MGAATEPMPKELSPRRLGRRLLEVALVVVAVVLLVTSVGATTLPDIKECNKHLRSAQVVRVVVNKVTERNEKYYGYY